MSPVGDSWFDCGTIKEQDNRDGVGVVDATIYYWKELEKIKPVGQLRVGFDGRNGDVSTYARIEFRALCAVGLQKK